MLGFKTMLEIIANTYVLTTISIISLVSIQIFLKLAKMTKCPKNYVPGQKNNHYKIVFELVVLLTSDICGINQTQPVLRKSNFHFKLSNAAFVQSKIMKMSQKLCPLKNKILYCVSNARLHIMVENMIYTHNVNYQNHV